jgi:hypothetical protein
MTGAYPGFEDYTRVSEVADAVTRLGSDGLMYVGATESSKRASAIAIELMDGVISPEVEKWMEFNDESDQLKYLASDWFASSVKGGVTRWQQGTADRGTIVGKVWDLLTSDPTVSYDNCVEFALQDMDREAEESKLSRAEYDVAISLGASEKDVPKPNRGYQCDLGDVVPYINQLVKWFPDCPFVSQQKQTFLKDDILKVCGTDDEFGLWRDRPMILDVKTSSMAQPKPYHRAQLAKYWDMRGSDPDVECMNLIITPQGVYPRILTQVGREVGLQDFNDALNVLRRSGMAGHYLPAKESK